MMVDTHALHYYIVVAAVRDLSLWNKVYNFLYLLFDRIT